MVSIIIIPVIVVVIIGIIGYSVYRFIIYDLICDRSVNKTLSRYNINKTQSEIIREYNDLMGETISEKKIVELKKYYRQHEPDQFLAMYDKIREKETNRDDQQ